MTAFIIAFAITSRPIRNVRFRLCTLFSHFSHLLTNFQFMYGQASFRSWSLVPLRSHMLLKLDILRSAVPTSTSVLSIRSLTPNSFQCHESQLMPLRLRASNRGWSLLSGLIHGQRGETSISSGNVQEWLL